MYEQDVRLPLAIQWKDKIKAGKTIDDLISFIDFAPTLLEAAGLPLDEQFQGESLLPLLSSDESGRMDSKRDRVYFGRERHDVGSEGDRVYPVRCIRTNQYLYIRNFKPELWPAGDPETGYTNCDSSPTKTHILQQHAKGDNVYYQLAFGRRPQEELYDIIADNECMNNLAAQPEYQNLKEKLWDELQVLLIETEDPRMLGSGDVFDSYEYTGDDHHSWKAYQEGRWRKQWY